MDFSSCQNAVIYKSDVILKPKGHYTLLPILFNINWSKYFQKEILQSSPPSSQIQIPVAGLHDSMATKSTVTEAIS